jgi:hypothetical protein
MNTFDPVCFEAFEQLLAQPDAADLPRRTHVYRCEGDRIDGRRACPGSHGRLQRRHLAIDIDEPIAPATLASMRRGTPGYSGSVE